METSQAQAGFTLRPATAGDARIIRKLIYQMQLSPLGLNWQHFILANDPVGQIIGCGQVKTHNDGSLELGSLGVLPEWRGRGVARKIIEHLLEQYPGRLYLTCRSELEPLYQKFGFRTLVYPEMPPYFQRISRIVASFNRLAHRPNHLLVMRRN